MVHDLSTSMLEDVMDRELITSTQEVICKYLSISINETIQIIREPTYNPENTQ